MNACRTTTVSFLLIAYMILHGIGLRPVLAEINGWTPLPWPEGGPVQSLLIDPQNPNTLYATGSVYNVTQGGGIFKSTNGGANWRAINFGLRTTAVTSLAIVSENQNVLYAGTLTGGVFKSIDGGESWGNTGLTNVSVWTLTIDPQNPRTVYA